MLFTLEIHTYIYCGVSSCCFFVAAPCHNVFHVFWWCCYSNILSLTKCCIFMFSKLRYVEVFLVSLRWNNGCKAKHKKNGKEKYQMVNYKFAIKKLMDLINCYVHCWSLKKSRRIEANFHNAFLISNFKFLLFFFFRFIAHIIYLYRSKYIHMQHISIFEIIRLCFSINL